MIPEKLWVHPVMCAYIGSYETCPDTSCNQITSRTELDSQANMPMVGRHVLLLFIDDLGTTVDVTPFAPDYPADHGSKINWCYSKVWLSRWQYMLLIWNAIHAPAMVNNMILSSSWEKQEWWSMSLKILVDDARLDHHTFVFAGNWFTHSIKFDWCVFISCYVTGKDGWPGWE